MTVIGGLTLLIGGAYVWWLALRDLLGSLFDGGIVDIVVGALLVGPFAASVILSCFGLLLELTSTNRT